MNENEEHTVSIDEIVGRILQLWDTDTPAAPEISAAEVVSALNFALEDVEARLEMTAGMSDSDGEATQLAADRDLLKEYIDRGVAIKRQIKNELEHKQQGTSESLLTTIGVTHDGDVYQHEETRATISSAFDWIKDTFNGLVVAEWAPPERSVSSDTQLGSAKPFTDLERAKLEVMLATTVELLAEKCGRKYLENGHPNYTQIAELVHTRIEKKKIELTGLAADTMRKRFKAAYKTMEEHQAG